MTGYGVDIAVNRIDDLDRLILDEILNIKRDVRVLDIGCGAGGQSLRMAKKGAKVCGVDIHDFSGIFQEIRKENRFTRAEFDFIHGSAADISRLVGGEQFDICVMQRVIHYVPYHEAKKILKYLPEIINDKLYISASGFGTYLKDYYKDKDKSVTERFCYLSEEGVKKFQIYNPLCLYTKEEFEKLLVLSGWKVERIWVSAFGNIKAVCSLV